MNALSQECEKITQDEKPMPSRFQTLLPLLCIWMR